MKHLWFLLLFAACAFSCEKDYHTSIPYAAVNIELWLDGVDFELRTNTAYKTIVYDQPRYEKEKGKTGFGGILIIRGLGADIYAFDLACPAEGRHEIRRDTRVMPDNTSPSASVVQTAITATCPKCGTVYTIADGSGAPNAGTGYRLRKYRVGGNGANYLVTN